MYSLVSCRHIKAFTPPESRALSCAYLYGNILLSVLDDGLVLCRRLVEGGGGGLGGGGDVGGGGGVGVVVAVVVVALTVPVIVGMGGGGWWVGFD